MPSWNDLLDELEAQPDTEKAAWLRERQVEALTEIGHRRGDRNVLYYASGFLQKPLVPSPWVQITHEDINGFMSSIYGMEWHKGLTIVLHTPGGVTNATETIVAYLLSKFSDIEVIIPTFAMSAGTMISLAANRVVMGRQSQLGPIDPQMPLSGGFVSARGIVDQFERAKGEIIEDTRLAHVWAPILQSIGPALLQEAQDALEYGEGMVRGWLEARMFHGRKDAKDQAERTASFFNDKRTHKSHGRRIDREEARTNGVIVEDLEDDQDLQEKVLSAYHLFTIVFEKTPCTKILASHRGRFWVKNFVPG